MPIPHLSKKTKSPQSWRQPAARPRAARGDFSGLRRELHQSRLNRTGKRGVFSRSRRPKKLPTANLIFLSIVALLIITIFGMGYVAWLSRDLPDPNRLIDRSIAESTKIYDRSGENILYEIHGAEKRTIVPLEQIPDYIKWATITVEDRTFYEHHGFNVLAIIKGVIIDPLTGKRARGGSTLTQQLVKNAILTNERKISRKIKELVLSYRIEKKFSKDEILQLYLNEIPYGSTSYGIEAAARRYFGISAKDLNLAQAAALAALPQAPTYYSPYGNNKDALIGRQQYILDEMEKLGYITSDQLENALNFNLEFKEQSENILAPHFVLYVKEMLSEKYGEQVIEQDGLKIYTTLDFDKQKIAEEVVSEWGEKNAKNYNANNAALVSIDPRNGQILAMVGSRDYFNDDIDGQFNVVLSPLQPGSSIKPIMYATFFSKGYTPNTILYDVVTNFAADGTDYTPKNYNLKEYGPVTVRQALAGSLNIPAVKALYLTGINNVIDQAHKMGYSTLNDPDRYGLSLVLGGGEVKLLDHANAYSVFANEGKYHAPVAILKIEDRNGHVLEEYKEKKPEQVLDVEAARNITNIISDNNARTFIFGAQNWLTLPNRPVAAKTGTTNDFHDAWTLGYTPSLVAGVWVGNNNNDEMKKGADSSTVAAPIWHEYMRRALEGTPVESFTTPQPIETGKAILDGTGAGEIKVKIDSVSGLLATENTPPELIIEKSFKQPHSILYYIKKDDPRGDPLDEKNRDPQFDSWEKAIREWAQREKITLDEIPVESDNIHNPELNPTISINSPANNAVIKEKFLSTNITTDASRGVGRVEYYLDNYLIGFSSSFPFNVSSVDISSFTNGTHSFTAKSCDVVGNCSTASQKININLNESEQNQSLSISWSSPGNEANLTKNNFPLELKVLSYNPQQIKDVSFYFFSYQDPTPKLIKGVKSPSSNEIIVKWDQVPSLGIYFLYAEASGTSGNKKTQTIKIIIKE